MQFRLNLVTFATLALTIFGLFLAGPVSVMGNGVPVRVFLNYLPDVSTWGPQTATGEAVVAVGEGWVTVSVQGLPKLPEDETYVAWLVPKEGETLPIGKFNTDDAGAGEFEIQDLSIPEKTYKLFLITAEDNADQYAAPGNRRSIAGRLPDPELRGAVPPPVPTAAPGSEPGGEPDTGESGVVTETGSSLAQPVPTKPAPAVLPVTGGMLEPVREDAELSLLTPKWSLMAVVGLALVGLIGLTALRQGGRS